MNKIWFAQMLRGLAALFVVFAHLFVIPLPYMGTLLKDPSLANSHIQTANFLQKFYFYLADSVVNLGAFGVGTFFLISGFVISFSIRKRDPVQFLLNRLFRVYPVVFIVLALDLLVLFIYSLFIVQSSLSSKDFYDFFINSLLIIRPLVGGIHVDGVLWTLEIELVFYIIIFLFGKIIIKSPGLFLLFISVLFTSFVGLAYIGSAVREGVPYFNFLYNSLPHLLLMCVGILFYCIATKNWRKKNILLVLLINLFYCSLSFTYLYRYNYVLSLSYFLLPLLSWSIFFYLDGKKLLPFNPILNFLANISFSLYLTHQILGFAIESILLTKLGFNVYLVIFLSILVCLVWAVLIYYVVELRAQRLSRRF